MHVCASGRQFGEAIALYFLFLQGYTKFLVFISAVGVYFYFRGAPYSTTYSTILLVWSVTFVEWWRIQQRLQSVRWGTKGSFRVEKRRAQYVPLSWWRKDLRALASLPVILFFASILAVLLTAIFVFEAFVTHLYTGPGHKFIVSHLHCLCERQAWPDAVLGIQSDHSLHRLGSSPPQYLPLICSLLHQLGESWPSVHPGKGCWS